MLLKSLILAFTCLSTALALSTDLDSCGKTCFSVAIATIGCNPTDVSCICTYDQEGKLGLALDDCLSATPGCSDAELASANEGRVVGLLAYFCYSTAPSASLALISAGAFTTTATIGGLDSQVSTTQASTTTAGPLATLLGATSSGVTTTTTALSPSSGATTTTTALSSSSSASSTATPSKSSSSGLVEKARIGILATVPFAFAAIGGAFALTA